MKRFAWITDAHLNFLDSADAEAFIRSLADLPADGFLLTGDLGEATNLILYLNALDTWLRRPVYFVLGNHDFYRGSIAGVRAQVEALCLALPNLVWMPRASSR